jgi:hypothetical protein
MSPGVVLRHDGRMATFQLRPDDSDDDYRRVQAAIDSVASMPQSGGVLVTRSADGSIRGATQTTTVPAGEVHERQLDS